MTIFLYRYIYNAAILILLIVLLTACSSTSLIYVFVEKFIQDEIAFFLDLDKEESVLLDQQVSEMVTWHRTSMLPSYAVYFNNIADKLEGDQYGANDITKILKNGRSLIKETVNGLTPFASKFLIRHQKIEAIEFIEKKMAIRRQERLEKISIPEVQLYEERLESLKLNFGRFFGNLFDEQVMLLEVHARMTIGDQGIRLKNRTLRQKAFISFLETQPTEVELTSYLNKLLLRGYIITNPDYKAFSETSLKRFKLLLVKMLAISSTKQRKKIISKLRDYAGDFESVAKN